MSMQQKRICKFSSWLAVLKYLNFIVYGSNIKHVWPPLVYTNEICYLLRHDGAPVIIIY